MSSHTYITIASPIISNLNSIPLLRMDRDNFSLNWTHNVLRNLKTKNAQQKTLSTQW